MATPNFGTFKNGRYHGTGDRIQDLIVGAHAPDNSPFYFMPAMPSIQTIMDPRWFYFSSARPYSSADWTVTTVGAGSAVSVTTDDALLFTNDAADNDLTQLQHLQTFTPAANAICGCYMRVQVSDATQHDCYGGLSSTDTSIVASEPADYAMFKKDDGDTILNGRTNDAGGTGSETANLLTNWTAATDYDLGVVLLPTSGSLGTAIFHYKLASAVAWSEPVTKTTDFPDAAMRFTMLSQNGEAVAKTMTVKRWAYWGFQP